MASTDVNNSLKEASLETLRSILSSNQEVRKAGETQIQALEVTEGGTRLVSFLKIICCYALFYFVFRFWYSSDRNLA